MKKIKTVALAIAYMLTTFTYAFSEEVLSNQSIISLVAAKVSSQIIISKVKSTPNNYDLSSQGVIDLKQGKVGDPIILEMLLAGKELPLVTNDDVIKMNTAKVSKNVILKKINLSRCAFNTDTDALIALKAANVPEPITKVMMDPASSASKNTGSSGSAGVSSANHVAAGKTASHPQDIPAPSSLPSPGIYYEEFSPNVSYSQIDPTTTNQTKEGGVGEGIGNHFTHGLSGTSKKVGLSNTTANMVIEDARPVFYFYLSMEEKDMNVADEGSNDGVTSPNDFVLVRATQTKRGREITIGYKNAYTKESGFAKGTIQYRYKKVSPRLYKVYFETDVPAGEYAFYYNKGSDRRSSYKLYDFSLRNNISVEKK